MVSEAASIQHLPSFRMRLSSLLRANHYLLLDVLILLAICVPLSYLVVVPYLTSPAFVTWGDNPWYLNRGALFARGLADDAFVYTVAYPLLVTVVNFFTHDLIAAGALINRFMFTVLVTGTYGMGRVFYGRRIAWIAALLISLNAVSVHPAARHTQTFLMFYAVVVVCVLCYALFVRRPNLWTALLFGVMLTIALYTRLEGITYGGLILVGAWQIYRASGSKRKALTLAFVSGVIVALGALYYLSVMARFSGSQDGPVFALFIMLRTVPFPWNELFERITGSFTSITVGWPAVVTVGAVAGVLWTRRKDRASNALFVLLVLMTVANLFFLSIRPKYQVGGTGVTFLGMLFAVFVVRLQERWRRLWPVSVLLVMSAAIFGLTALTQYLALPRDDYHLSKFGQDAARVDAWLAERGLQSTEIYTFCSSLISYSQSNFHLVYRLGIRDMNSPEWYNSPLNLFPMLREKHQLFMHCDSEQIYFKDWEAYMDGPPPTTFTLHEIGRVDDYVFYEVQ